MSPAVANLVVSFLLLFVLAIAVTMILHLWLRVPYVPTPRAVARAMVRAARLKGDERVVDLGAGNGRILIEAKRLHPGLTAVGCELVPTIWLLGKLTILLSGQRIEWKLRNALTEDVSQADVIFLYLTGPLMKKLQERFDRELRPGTRVVSHCFRFHGREPSFQTSLPGWMGENRVYVYEW